MERRPLHCVATNLHRVEERASFQQPIDGKAVIYCNRELVRSDVLGDDSALIEARLQLTRFSDLSERWLLRQKTCDKVRYDTMSSESHGAQKALEKQVPGFA